jgi:hypothetical protein
VKIGQVVNIKLNGYPYMEYGLVTTTGTSLSFTGELSGIAEIITDDRSFGETAGIRKKHSRRY